MKNLQADSSLFFLFRCIWGYISRKRKFQFYLLLGLTILSAFAEVISLGAVLPFIAIITQPEELFSSPYMSKLNTMMNFTCA